MSEAPLGRLRRFRRYLRLGGGWLMVALAVAIWFAAAETSETPQRDCGAPAIVVLFDPNASTAVPPSFKDDCHGDAVSTVVGTTCLLIVPGLLLVFWPRLRRRVARMQDDAVRRAAKADPGRAVGRSYIGPAPIALSFVSPLSAADAAARLRTLGNGGPQGSLRVRLVDDHVDARLVLQNTPKFAGTLAPRSGGTELRGLVRPGSDERARFVFGAVFAGVLGLVGFGMLIASAPSGRINYGFAPVLALAAFMAAFAAGIRHLGSRSFPVSVNRLSRVLASALDTEAPQIETRPLSTGAAKAVGLGFIGLQIAVVGARAFIASGFFAAVMLTAGFAAIFVLLFRTAKHWSPRLDGDTLRVAFRRVDLSAVTDVRARGSLMSLSDGRARVVVSSAFGRPETIAEAEQALRDATVPVERERAQIVQAIGQVVDRCPLDETTASTLHRPVTLPGASRPGPRLDPAALAPAGIMLGAMAVLFATIFALGR